MKDIDKSLRSLRDKSKIQQGRSEMWVQMETPKVILKLPHWVKEETVELQNSAGNILFDGSNTQK